MIGEGLSNQEIADHLFLGINSVKTYIRSAYRKLHVTARPQAILGGDGARLGRPAHPRRPLTTRSLGVDAHGDRFSSA